MKKLDGNTCAHVGIVVENVNEYIENLRSVIDNVEIIAEVNYPPKGYEKSLNLKLREKDAEFGSKITFVKMGGMVLELFEPSYGDSSWKEFLDKNGNCVHHMYFSVESINDAMELFASKDIECISRGESKDGLTWCYFDTFKKFGFDIEAKNTTHGEKVITK